MEKKDIIILHDLNGKPYYEALEFLAKKNNINIFYYESSVLKLFIRDIIKKQFSILTIKRTIKNFFFRLKIPFIKDKIIIMGMAPYDFRLIFYKFLLKKNILIYHTSHPYWGDDFRSPRKYGFLTRIIKRFWMRFLQQKKLRIVTVTKTSFNNLKKNFKINGNIEQIYHCVNINKFRPDLDRDFDKINILFVGRLSYEKGLDTLVELIEILDNNRYNFYIVGDGEYKDKIKHVFGYKNVTYYGWIDKKDLNKIYSQCHIFLNPSIKTSKWEELFGIVNIEAMSSGLVVIASNHVGPSEIIKDKVNGFLVPERDPIKIKEIIEYLDKNKDLFFKIRKNAVISAKKFSVEEISKKWQEIIFDN